MKKASILLIVFLVLTQMEISFFFAENFILRVYADPDLEDNFNDNSLNLTKWEDLELTGFSVAETNQQLEITTDSSATNYAKGGIQTVESYNITGHCSNITCVSDSFPLSRGEGIGIYSSENSSRYYIIFKRDYNDRWYAQGVDSVGSFSSYGLWAGETGDLCIKVTGGTTYFYENNNQRHTRTYNLGTEDVKIRLFSMKYGTSVGTDELDDFETDIEEIVDLEYPTYSHVGTNCSYPEQPCLFHVLCDDDLELDYACFRWDQGNGTWTANETCYNNAGESSKWANSSKTLPGTYGTVVHYRFYFNDTANKWNETGIQAITVNWLTFVADSSRDGYLWKYDDDSYSECQSATPSVQTSAVLLSVGQNKLAGAYYIYRGYYSFDTSLMSQNYSQFDAARVRLRLKFYAHGLAGSNFTMRIYNKTYGTLDSGDWSSGSPQIGEWNSTSFTADGNIIEWELGAGVLVKNGFTQLMLVSNRDEIQNTPTSSEWVQYYTNNSAYSPLLFVRLGKLIVANASDGYMAYNPEDTHLSETAYSGQDYIKVDDVNGFQATEEVWLWDSTLAYHDEMIISSVQSSPSPMINFTTSLTNTYTTGNSSRCYNAEFSNIMDQFRGAHTVYQAHWLGQNKLLDQPPVFEVSRVYTRFDTTGINAYNITGVFLELTCYYDASQTDWKLLVTNGSGGWGDTLGEEDWGFGTNVSGSYFVENQPKTSIISIEINPLALNNSGFTEFELKTQREGTEPTQDESIIIYSVDAPCTAFRPRLVVEYHQEFQWLSFLFTESSQVSDSFLSSKEKLSNFMESIAITEQAITPKEILNIFSEKAAALSTLFFSTEIYHLIVEAINQENVVISESFAVLKEKVVEFTESTAASSLASLSLEISLRVFEFFETVLVNSRLFTPSIPVTPFVQPLLEVVFLFCLAWFYSIGFFGKTFREERDYSDEQLIYGFLAFVCWIILGAVWLLINPLSVSVSLIFGGLGMLILIIALIVLLRRLQFRRHG